jgi:hypothetical protein
VFGFNFNIIFFRTSLSETLEFFDTEESITLQSGLIKCEPPDR